MIWLLLGTLIPSFLVAWAACFVVRRKAARWGLVDEPGERKVHTRTTPLGGGLAIWLGVMLPLISLSVLVFSFTDAASSSSLGSWLPEFARPHLAGLQSQLGSLWLLLALGTLVMLLGLADDLRGLPWQIRLGAEFLVAATVVFWQGWRLTAFVDWPLVTGVASVLWIVWLINSFNMLDNMDGLSGGVAAIAAAMLAAVLLAAPDPTTNQPQLFVGGLLLVLVGALSGFLWHNRPPARLFMGDAGSYFVGFLIAVATLLATFSGGQAPRHAILAPLCVLAIPLYDTVSVLWIRFREGRSPFVGDKSHFSHRLVDLGMTKSQAVLTIYLATATCGLGAFLLHQVNAAGAVIVLTMVACTLGLVAVLERTARRKVRNRD
ncbi:MAG: MraY family glycosyltransferase [Pirellulales bacterium]